MALRRTTPTASRTARLHGLAALGWLGLNFPLITLWDHRVTLLGLPLMGLALFAGWAVLIGAAAWIAERGDDDENGHDLADGGSAAATVDPRQD
jgi:hypothetical protein